MRLALDEADIEDTRRMWEDEYLTDFTPEFKDWYATQVIEIASLLTRKQESELEDKNLLWVTLGYKTERGFRNELKRYRTRILSVCGSDPRFSMIKFKHEVELANESKRAGTVPTATGL